MSRPGDGHDDRMATSSSAPLSACLQPTLLRTARAGAHPWPGDVVVSEAGTSLLVDATHLEGWRGWDAVGEHTVAPVSVLRTAGGQSVLLPLCTQRLDALVTARADSLSPGECVTLAVSLLRGVVDDLGQHTDLSCTGCWWLTDDGRPVFVHDDEGESLIEATAHLLADAGQTTQPAGPASVGPLLREIATVLHDPERLARVAPDLEERAFAIAAPEPLATTLLPRRRARADPPTSPAGADPHLGSPPELPLWRRVADSADAGIGELLSQAFTGLWRRARAQHSGRSRRGVVMVAVGAAALAVAVGLLWPSSDESVAVPASSVSPAEAVGASPSVPEPSAAQPAAAPVSSTPSDAASGPPSEDADADPVATADRLLAAVAACGGDADCRAGLHEQGASSPVEVRSDGAAFAPGRTLSLLDDLGGLVLLRAEDPARARVAQIVVIVREKDRWLLRDVHDVAQQP